MVRRGDKQLNFMKFISVAVVLIILCSCSKIYNSTEGNVKVSFYPVLTQYKDSTYYWYLYSENGYSTLPPIRKGYVGHADSFNNGRANISINNLNEGNYIFTYYLNDNIKTNSIQVSAGATKSYFLK
jgi:hypothetical protein